MFCSHCSVRSNDKKFKKCGKCQLNAYCSIECQRVDWPTHKILCRPSSAKDLVKILSKKLFEMEEKDKLAARSHLRKASAQLRGNIKYYLRFDDLDILRDFIACFSYDSFKAKVTLTDINKLPTELSAFKTTLNSYDIYFDYKPDKMVTTLSFGKMIEY